MKRALSPVLVAVVLWVAPISFASTSATAAPPKSPAKSAPPKSKLAKPYSLATGQLVALIVPHLASNFHLVELPILAVYDAEEDKVEILLFGRDGTVDAAKQAIEDFREKALDPITSLVAEIYDLELSEDDFSLAYYDAAKNKLVLEWADDEYKMH